MPHRLPGEKRFFSILLGAGADIKGQSGLYGSALQAASFFGSETIVCTLLDLGADANIHSGANHYDSLSELQTAKHGDTSLALASLKGDLSIVRLLLDRGADVKIQCGFYGTALHAAAIGGKKEIVRVLLNGGADITAQGGFYGTVLHAAGEGDGSEDVVQVLLANGWSYMFCPLHTAALRGCLRTIQLLLTNGAHVDGLGVFYSGKHDTPVEIAAYWGGQCQSSQTSPSKWCRYKPLLYRRWQP